MSSRTVDSQQPPVTSLKRHKVGAPLGTVPANKSPSFAPELVGQRFGSVEIISPNIEWRGPSKWRQYRFVKVRCVTCSRESSISLDNLRAGRTKGCRSCNQPKRFPSWLYSRVQSQERRCTNPKARGYERYGGRGVRFNFQSVSEACLWIKEHLGIHRDMQLDRIDNDGHYEPGNLKWSTQPQNLAHTRKAMRSAALHRFRQLYPEVRYADVTLKRLIRQGMTFEEIEDRFHNLDSKKPKGKYGTFSTPDPFIASLHKDC